ncbi:hypothetical protein RPMA_18385 [Tardiphaga alba]|uniref:HTH luxR-type domain-containing protein n=1 Tax=Tardiphaga alba TaxID=340268 RepID=A0ABX8AJ76_9BRAD|nr:hypothetical protein RPMA_18385 [Tardiphaga alba]
MLLALGWSNGRIANALHITEPTLRKHYFSVIKFRDQQRDRMDAAVASTLWRQFVEGSTAAGKVFMAFVEKNDRMEIERTMASAPSNADGALPERVGKKQVDAQRAIDADADLMAELEQEAAAQNATAVH